MNTYTQVLLGNDTKQLVTYIETRYADTNLRVTLEEGVDAEFWDVLEVYPSSKISAETAKANAHKWVNYIKKTDI